MVTISGGFYLLFGIKARADGGDTDIHNDGDVAGGAADCKQIVPTLLPSHRATSLWSNSTQRGMCEQSFPSLPMFGEGALKL